MKRFLKFIASLSLNLLILVVVITLINKSGVIGYGQDWMLAKGYQPQPEVQAATDALSLTNYSKRLVRASRTRFYGVHQFNISCRDIQIQEDSYLLGCYAEKKIYIYDITNPELEDGDEATLAHEMLHAGYDRLGQNEIIKLNNLLNRQLTSGISASVQKHIDVYKKSGISENLLMNEVHSILGTEQPNLIPELEEYYSKYFTDRSAVLKLNAAYNKVFGDIEAELDGYKKQLDEYGAELEQVQAKIKLNNASYDKLYAEAQSRLSLGDTAGYNKLVPQINAIVSGSLSLDARQQTLIKNYNDTVQKHNALVEKLQLLNKSVDPKKAESVSGG